MKSNIMSEPNIEFKSKFEGVFEVSCSANIFDAYKNLIAFCENLLNNKSNIKLSMSEINLFFDVGGKEKFINDCNVEDLFAYYKIILNWGKDNNIKILELKKKEYKFLMEEKNSIVLF